jgi:hypothetical protein
MPYNCFRIKNFYYYVSRFEAENEGPSTKIMIQIFGGK